MKKKCNILLVLFCMVCSAYGQRDDYLKFCRSMSGTWFGSLYKTYSPLDEPISNNIIQINKYYKQDFLFTYEIEGTYDNKNISWSGKEVILNYDKWEFLKSKREQHSISYILMSKSYIFTYDSNLNKGLYFSIRASSNYVGIFVGISVSDSSVSFENPRGAIDKDGSIVVKENQLQYINMREYSYDLSYCLPNEINECNKFLDDNKNIHSFTSLGKVKDPIPHQFYKEKIIREMFTLYMNNILRRNYAKEEIARILENESNATPWELAMLKQIKRCYDFIENLNGDWVYITYDKDGKETYKIEIPAMM